MGALYFGSAGARDISLSTTTPPIVYSNSTVSTNLNLYPQARRNSGSFLDIGYSYPALDYCFGQVLASNTITFNPGTMAGWFSAGGGTAGLPKADPPTCNLHAT